MLRKIKQSLLLLPLVAALLSSCSGTPDSARLIPKDAIVVMGFNMKDFADQADMGDQEEASATLEKLLKNDDVSAKTREKILELWEDPGMTGFDLSETMFFFVSESFTNNYAFVGGVSDEDDLKDFLDLLAKEDVCTKAHKYSDLYYSVFDGNSLLAFDDDFFVFTPITWEQRSKSDDIDDAARLAVDEVKTLFDQKKEKSIADNDQFAELCSRDGFMTLFVNGPGLEDIPQAERELKQIEEKTGIRIQDYDILATLATDKGETVFEAELVGTTEAAQKKLEDLGKYSKTIQGNYLSYLDANAIFTMAFGNNGKDQLDLLNKSGLMGELCDAEYQGIAGELLKNLNGDVALQLTTVEADGQPEFALYAASDKSDGIQQFGEMLVQNNVASMMEPNKFLVPLSSLKNMNGGSSYNDSYYDEYVMDSLAAEEFQPDSNEPELECYGPDPDCDEYELNRYGPEPDCYADYATEPQSGKDCNCLFGWKQGAAYMVVGPNPTAFQKPGKVIDKAPFENRKFYARFNFAALVKSPLMRANEGSPDADITVAILKLFDYVEAYIDAENPYRLGLRVVMVDKENSPAKTLIEAFFKEMRKQL